MMADPKPITAYPGGLFEAFRQGHKLSAEVAASQEIGSDAVTTVAELENITASVTELAVNQSVVVSAIDGDKTPFVHHFRINELSRTKSLLGDLKTIPGKPGRFQASEDYNMTMFPGYYRNVYPLRGQIRGRVVGVNLESSDLIVKRRGVSDALLGSRTWVRLLSPDGETPLVKVDFV
ncbi:MAG TPA: hypothetical protein VFX86_04490 [Candidatus Saccharimonadales bacterium]|nr:hypothetical protein [Candidatus Saccharimonadales bacterium]